jgi:carbonic anhydrase
VPFDVWLARSHSLLPLLLLGFGCNKLFAKDEPAPAAEEKAEASEHAEASSGAAAEHAAPGSGRYSVPFAWEISPEEPLAKARRFMGDVLSANDVFMAQGRDHFKPFLEAEHPRATVLTCADSRIQPSAWDANPENDSYTVRNLGNQLSTALGSVEYGVERLHTPVLLIIGHTGCEAIQSALDESEKDKKSAIATELSHLELAKGDGKKHEMSLLEAVTANVNAQVAEAVAHFAPYVQSGELTVVGAVYDHKNELEEGNGRLQLVNVNSNVEQARIDAFKEAVKEKKVAAPAPSAAKRPGAPDDRMRSLFEGARSLPDGRASISAVNIIGNGGFDAVEAGTLHEAPARGASPARPSARTAEQNKADIAASLQLVAAAVGAHGPAQDEGAAAPGHGAPAPGHSAPPNAHAAPAAASKPRAAPAPDTAGHGAAPREGAAGHGATKESGRAPPAPPLPKGVLPPPGPPPTVVHEAVPLHDAKSSAPAKAPPAAHDEKAPPAKAPAAGHEKPAGPAKAAPAPAKPTPEAPSKEAHGKPAGEH